MLIEGYVFFLPICFLTLITLWVLITLQRTNTPLAYMSYQTFQIHSASLSINGTMEETSHLRSPTY